jgi:hypothetical protein
VGTDVETGRKASTEERNLGTARLPLIDNQHKSGVREQSLKKESGYDFAARRAKDHVAHKRRDIEAAKPTIRYCLVMLDLLSDKRRRSYTTQKVMRGLV